MFVGEWRRRHLLEHGNWRLESTFNFQLWREDSILRFARMKPKTEECKINTLKITEITHSSKVAAVLKTEIYQCKWPRYEIFIYVSLDEGNMQLFHVIFVSKIQASFIYLFIYLFTHSFILCFMPYTLTCSYKSWFIVVTENDCSILINCSKND